MRWLEMVIDVPAQAAEAAAAAVLAVVDAGLAWEERDGSVRIRAYLPEEGFEERYRQLGERWRRVRQVFPAVGPWAPAVRARAEEEWAEAWKAHFRPLPVGRRLLVVPSWQRDRVDPGPRIPLVLDPGMAFGTGQHASTRLALELLEEELEGQPEPLPVLDVGTGSGILAIAAALLGARPVLAVDIDPGAVRVAQENAAANGVDDRVRVAPGTAAAVRRRPPSGWAAHLPTAITVANITAEVLAEALDDLVGLTRPGGALIVSGLVEGAPDTRDLEERCRARGLGVRRRRRAEGWEAWRLAVPN
ncbi:MAG TPA: 50S ribosomal protein L11 methyltransferase [Thermaerobacter sp.]